MAEVKKVAFVHGEFPVGGAERVTCDIATALLERGGYEVYVFAREYNPELLPSNLASDSRFHVIVSPTLGKIKLRKSWEFVIDGVRANGIGTVVFVMIRQHEIANELRRMGCRTVYANHGTPFWEVPSKRQRARQNSHKGLVKAAKYYLTKYLRYEKTNMLERRYRKRYKKDIVLYGEYMVLCDGYRKLIARDLKLSRENKSHIHVIPNMQKPVADVCYDKRKEFLFVGRLSYSDKRIDRLIDAWRMICDKLPDWSLVVVGDGPDAKRLKSLAKGLPRVSFEGYQSPTEYYRHASALCLVSEYEGFPLCLIEAQSHGVVPISMDMCEGVRSIVGTDGSAGMLTPKGDVQAFADKMLEFAAMDEDKKQRLRHQVVAKSLEYSPNTVIQKWIDLFNQSK